MDSQQDSKLLSASNGSHEDFFFMFTRTYLFISRHFVIYLFISGCPSTRCYTIGTVLDDADTLALPSFPLSFNTAAAENQTALKQIDVLFNIVVTSSQGPHAFCLGDDGGVA